MIPIVYSFWIIVIFFVDMRRVALSSIHISCGKWCIYISYRAKINYGRQRFILFIVCRFCRSYFFSFQCGKRIKVLFLFFALYPSVPSTNQKIDLFHMKKKKEKEKIVSYEEIG